MLKIMWLTLILSTRIDVGSRKLLWPLMIRLLSVVVGSPRPLHTHTNTCTNGRSFKLVPAKGKKERNEKVSGFACTILCMKVLKEHHVHSEAYLHWTLRLGLKWDGTTNISSIYSYPFACPTIQSLVAHVLCRLSMFRAVKYFMLADLFL